MDWEHVSALEVLDALREADWGRPRPLHDFIGRFSPPRDIKKWTSRLKANGFYYRANYVLLAAGCYAVAFLRSPFALLALVIALCGVLAINDSAAAALNDHLLRLVRRIHPPTALKIRARTLQSAPPLSPYQTARRGGRRGQAHVYVLGFPRTVFVAACLTLTVLLLRVGAGWRALLWGTAWGVGLPVLHASLRSPNLKARLSNTKQDFKAMWRAHQQEVIGAGTLGPGISFATAYPTNSQPLRAGPPPQDYTR